MIGHDWKWQQWGSPPTMIWVCQNCCALSWSKEPGSMDRIPFGYIAGERIWFSCEDAVVYFVMAS